MANYNTGQSKFSHMGNTWIIVIGLTVDALGALMIAVPDLPPRLGNKIRKITPKIRHYHSATQVLRGNNFSKIRNNQKQLMKEVKTVWPAVRAYYTKKGIGELDEVDLWWSEDSGREIVVGTNLRPSNPSLSPSWFASRAEEYIESRYRTWGWMALSLGFTIQILGTLIP